jgi:hypothetical protein
LRQSAVALFACIRKFVSMKNVTKLNSRTGSVSIERIQENNFRAKKKLEPLPCTHVHMSGALKPWLDTVSHKGPDANLTTYYHRWRSM